jgi:hypothetical protein
MVKNSSRFQYQKQFQNIQFSLLETHPKTFKILSMNNYFSNQTCLTALIFVVLMMSCSNEQSQWQQVKQQNSIAEYEKFINKYPQSVFIDSAKYKIDQLQWHNAKQLNSIAEFEKFINKYPQSVFIDSAKNRIDQKRPEFTFYAEDRMGISLNLIFDPSHSGKLCEKPEETVFLKTPSDSINPWTFLFQGHFSIQIDDKNTTVYGYYQYMNAVSSEGVEWIIAAFAQKGRDNKPGEKWIGALPSDGSIVTFDDKNNTIVIGQYQYMNVKVTDDKEPKVIERTVTATRMINPIGPWTTQLENKIFKIEEDNTLNQIGWCEWRKCYKPDGTVIVILMSKAMDKDAKWAGCYEGKLFKEE